MANVFSDPATLMDPYQLLTEPQTQTGYPLDREIEGCGPGRREVIEVFQYQGKTYRTVARDKVLAEDWLSSQVKAAAYARKEVEDYRGAPPSRALKEAVLQADLET